MIYFKKFQIKLIYLNFLNVTAREHCKECERGDVKLTHQRITAVQVARPRVLLLFKTCRCGIFGAQEKPLQIPATDCSDWNCNDSLPPEPLDTQPLWIWNFVKWQKMVTWVKRIHERSGQLGHTLPCLYAESTRIIRDKCIIWPVSFVDSAPD